MSAQFASSLGVLEEPGGLEALLIDAGALALIAQVKNAADLMELDAGGFAMLAMRRFAERASDEDWASLTSAANAQEDALGHFVVRVLRKAVADANEVFQ